MLCDLLGQLRTGDSPFAQLCLRMRALGVLSRHGSSVATLTTRDGRLTRTGHVGVVKEGARETLLFSPAAVRAPSHLPDW